MSMKFLISRAEAERVQRDKEIVLFKNWTVALRKRLINSGWTENNPVPCTLYCYSLHLKLPMLLLDATILSHDRDSKIHCRKMRLKFIEQKSIEELVEDLKDD